MNYLSKVNGYLFKVPNVVLDPNHIHINGAIYGTKGIGRVLSIPAVKYNAIAAVFSSAAYAMGVHYSDRTKIFLICLGISLSLNTVVSTFELSVNSSSDIRKIKKLVIDKRNKLTADLYATHQLIEYYKSTSWRYIFPASILLGIFTGDKFYSKHHLSPLACGLLVTLSAAFTFPGAWRYYACGKLSKGDWVVRANPPELKPKKVKDKVSQLVKSHRLGRLAL